ncbi:MAG: spondin domain-containing protein [Chloroflexi bacterium]|nr:spondin domain-containing protein [Chloroflexota bacterium]MDA1227705.1 spondin domain-containing protein [Chloroflexota bacterium]
MKSKVAAMIIGGAALAALSVGGVGASPHSGDSDGIKYEISITNLTKNQPLSPVTVATHTRNLDALFTPGEAATPELAAVAEDADSTGLSSLLDPATNDDVNSLETIFGVNGPILPGETASVTVEAKGKALFFSLVGMLVNTNDAFTAVRGHDLVRGDRMIWVPAYDAGSEANNEDCAFIPGPACGNPHVRDTANAEGYVYIHSGIHGIADLEPATYDWNSPVALVEVKRVVR